jgi:prolyl 4-hydroxylase
VTSALPVRFEAEALLWTVDEVFTTAECEGFVARIEESAPALATDNPLYRNQDRVIADDPAVAADLFARLRPHLPARMGALRLEGLNTQLRFYRYREGQAFAPHMDHWYRPDACRVTLHTVLVYFNKGFAGGETRFSEQLDAVVVPKPGRVAIFQHKLRHEGCAVTRGTKYALRTDTIYAGDEPIGRAVFPPE